MRAAAARGKRAGNPGLRSRDPAAIRKLSEARRAGHLGKLIAGAEAWLPEVRRLRQEGRSWEDVVRYLNARRPRAPQPGRRSGWCAGSAASSPRAWRRRTC